MSATRVGRECNLTLKFRVCVGLAVKVVMFLVFTQGSATAASPLIHSSANTGSTKYSWGSSYTCATCHTDSPSPNIRKVSSAIATPLGNRPVVFTRIETFSNNTTGVFGNDERLYNQ